MIYDFFTINPTHASSLDKPVLREVLPHHPFLFGREDLLYRIAAEPLQNLLWLCFLLGSNTTCSTRTSIELLIW